MTEANKTPSDIVAALDENTLRTVAYMCSKWFEGVDPDIKMVGGQEVELYYLQPAVVAEIDAELPDTFENFYIWADGEGLIGDDDDFDPEDQGKIMPLNNDNIGDDINEIVADDLGGRDDDKFVSEEGEDEDLPEVPEIDAPILIPTKSFMTSASETFMEARLVIRKLNVMGDGISFTVA